jgi:hypothetical protein
VKYQGNEGPVSQPCKKYNLDPSVFDSQPHLLQAPLGSASSVLPSPMGSASSFGRVWTNIRPLAVAEAFQVSAPDKHWVWAAPQPAFGGSSPAGFGASGFGSLAQSSRRQLPMRFVCFWWLPAGLGLLLVARLCPLWPDLPLVPRDAKR